MGCLGGRWLAGSLADGGRSQEAAASYVERGLRRPRQEWNVVWWWSSATRYPPMSQARRVYRRPGSEYDLPYRSRSHFRSGKDQAMTIKRHGVGPRLSNA